MHSSSDLNKIDHSQVIFHQIFKLCNSRSIDGVMQDVISYLPGPCNKIVLLHQNYMYYPQTNCKASCVILGNMNSY